GNLYIRKGATQRLESRADRNIGGRPYRQLAHVPQALHPFGGAQLQARPEILVASGQPRGRVAVVGRALRRPVGPRPVVEPLGEGGRHEVGFVLRSKGHASSPCGGVGGSNEWLTTCYPSVDLPHSD